MLKEGCEYRVKIYFYVQRDIVQGLKYVQMTYKAGIRGKSCLRYNHSCRLALRCNDGVVKNYSMAVASTAHMYDSAQKVNFVNDLARGSTRWSSWAVQRD